MPRTRPSGADELLRDMNNLPPRASAGGAVLQRPGGPGVALSWNGVKYGQGSPAAYWPWRRLAAGGAEAGSGVTSCGAATDICQRLGGDRRGRRYLLYAAGRYVR
jgi:hypothetical protein